MQCKTELVGQVGLFAVLGMATICPSHSVQAQITPDTTLGAEASQVVPGVAVPGGQGTLIEGGATRGAHLFHSFSDFNVGNGQRVYFDNPAGVLNIFSRVTGNSGSNILGTLGVDGMANLYLLNPNGIVFGPNAQLDVSGSFVASTANRLMFDNGQFFSAVAPNQPPLLQINVTPGLQYGNNLNATIRNQGNLQVGQNLTLGAQRLELAGSLEAGRDITLQGWSRQLSNADYMVGGYLFTQDLTGQGIDLLIPHENVILANGDVRFTQNYVGESLHVLAGGQVSRAAGANNITITGTSGGSVTERIATGTGGLQAVTVTASDQPMVDIRSGVDWSQLTGGLPGNSNTSAAAIAFGVATGDSIALRNITNNGGDIALWAAGDITANNLDTSFSISSVDEDIQVEDGGAITAWAEGNIEANILTSFVLTESEIGDVIGGKGGNVSLSSGHNIDISYIDSGSLSRSSFGNVVGADGGTVFLIADNNVDVLRRIFSSSSAISDVSLLLPLLGDAVAGNVVGANGGDISLVAGQTIGVGDSIDSFSLSHSLSLLYPDTDIREADTISGDVIGGDGGNISLAAGQGDINVGSIDSFSDSISRSQSYIYATSGQVTGGHGGGISLVARRNINVDDRILSGSYSTSDAVGAFPVPFLMIPNSDNVVGGDGGNIALDAGQNISVGSIDSISFSQSRAASNAPSDSRDATGGDGGNIYLIAGQNINIDSINSSSFSSSDPNGNPDDFLSSVVGGNGGAIFLVAGQHINIDGSISSVSKLLSYPTIASVIGGGGGGISLVAEQGININGDIDSSSEWIVFGGNTTIGGNGGDISLVAKQKSINVEGSINSSSLTYLYPFYLSETSGSIGGNGGSVSLVAHRDIRLSSIDSFSLTTSETFLDEGTAVGGNGGAISLKAKTGSISVFAQVDQFSGELSNPSFQTFSVTNQSFFIAGGEAGNGGNVILEAATQIGAENVRFPVEILTLSSSAQSGTVQITGLGETFDLLNTVVITSKTIEIENPLVFGAPIRIPVGEVGQSGDISVFGSGNITFTNSFFLSNTNGSDPAGNVTIRTPGSITFNNSSIETNTQSTGTAGDIDIRAASLTLDSRSQITAVTRSSGRAGNIRLRPYGNGQTLSINLNGEDSLISSSSLLPEAPDENANVIIDGIDGTDADLVSDGTYTYIVFDDVYIVLDSEDIIFDSLKNSNEDANVIIDGIDGIDADLVSDGTHTYIVFDDVYIVLGDEGIIFNSSNFNGSEVTGNSGNIFISAPAAVTIQGEGDLKVETETSGNAGRLAINAPQVIVDGVEVSASSELPDLLTDELSEDAISQVRANYQSGQGGSIEINTRELILRDRAEITADTSTLGRGGNLIVQNMGNPLTIRGDGQLTVSASGDNSGRAGTLVINASGLLSLLDGIELAASSESINGGGEIDITVDGSLFMAGDSIINASASNPNAGDGGNININLIDGLLIAPPGQNNDIIANAAGGNGGKITITALGIYGFTLQDISDVEVLRSNSTNDISASSDAGIDGEITLNTFELDLNQLSELPANLVDVSGLAEQSLCEAGRGSEFVVTGRGGLPSSPNDALNSTATWEDWSISSSPSESASALHDEALETSAIAPSPPPAPSDPSTPSATLTDPPIIEAQGWTKNANGQMVLVADSATVIPDGDQLLAPGCRQLRPVVSSENRSPQSGNRFASVSAASVNP